MFNLNIKCRFFGKHEYNTLILRDETDGELPIQVCVLCGDYAIGSYEHYSDGIVDLDERKN